MTQFELEQRMAEDWAEFEALDWSDDEDDGDFEDEEDDEQTEEELADIRYQLVADR